MEAPWLEIDLGKIRHNAVRLGSLLDGKKIGIMGVTKAVCGDPEIGRVFVESGISILADSRLENLRRLRQAKIKARLALLRTPSPSRCESVVNLADISFNTEISVLKGLSECALKAGKSHQVILMVEMGDLREGILPEDLGATMRAALKLEGIEILGIGTNLACLGGIRPDEGKMRRLSELACEMEKAFHHSFEIVSGGNSANYEWLLKTEDPGRINNLRLGESILLGRETLHGNPIPDLHTNAFLLGAEVIESGIKPTLPYGEITSDAFGNVPHFEDRGSRKRAILALGIQDVMASGLICPRGMEILGASSDHIILDTGERLFHPGDIISFKLGYGALCTAMASPYITKVFK